MFKFLFISIGDWNKTTPWLVSVKSSHVQISLYLHRRLKPCTSSSTTLLLWVQISLYLHRRLKHYQYSEAVIAKYVQISLYLHRRLKPCNYLFCWIAALVQISLYLHRRLKPVSNGLECLIRQFKFLFISIGDWNLTFCQKLGITAYKFKFLFISIGLSP